MSLNITREFTALNIKRVFISIRKIFWIKRWSYGNRSSHYIECLFSFLVLCQICTFKKWIFINFKTISCSSFRIYNSSFTTGCLNCLIFCTSWHWIFCNNRYMWARFPHDQKISFFTLIITNSMRSLSKTHCCGIISFWQTSLINKRINHKLRTINSFFFTRTICSIFIRPS